MQITNITNERGDINTSSKDIKRIIRKYHGQLYANQLTIDNMENFLNIYKLPNLMKVETDNPNSPISIKEIETVVKSLPIRSKTRMSAFTIAI